MKEVDKIMITAQKVYNEVPDMTVEEIEKLFAVIARRRFRIIDSGGK